MFYKLDNSLNFMRGLLAMKWGLLRIKVKWDGGRLDITRLSASKSMIRDTPEYYLPVCGLKKYYLELLE